MQITAQDAGLKRSLAAAHQGLLGLAKTKVRFPGGGLSSALGLAGVGLGIRANLDAAIEMESKMATLAKATDLEGDALAAMKAQLLRLSVTIKGVRINDLLDIATAGAKLGIANNDLAGYAEGIAKVSAAIDDLPAGVIADEIGKINSVFKLDAIRGTQQLGSAIDKLADSGVSSASGILDVTQRISGTAVAARITAQESTALAAALLDTGTNAESGATALQRLIMALNSPDLKERKNFAQVIGADMKTFADTVEKRPIEAIKGFLKAVKGMDAQSQQRAIMAIGIENVHGAAEIQKLSQQVDTLDRYVGLANSEFLTLNQLTKSYGASAKTTKAQLATMNNQFQILGDRLGSTFLPAVNSALSLLGDLGTGLGDVWEKASAGVKSWGADFSGVFDRISYSLRNLGDLLEIVGIRIGGGFMEAWTLLSYGVKVAAATASYLVAIFADGFQQLLVAATNLKDNFVSIFKELWAWLASMGKDPIEFKLKPILEGSKAGPIRFEMPELDMSGANVDNQIQAVQDRIAAREAARNGLAPGGPGKPPGNVGGTSQFGNDGNNRNKGQISDLASFAQSLQQAVGGKDKLQERGVKAAERTAKATEEIAMRNGGQGLGFLAGPAWQAAGLA